MDVCYGFSYGIVWSVGSPKDQCDYFYDGQEYGFVYFYVNQLDFGGDVVVSFGVVESDMVYTVPMTGAIWIRNIIAKNETTTDEATTAAAGGMTSIVEQHTSSGFSTLAISRVLIGCVTVIATIVLLLLILRTRKKTNNQTRGDEDISSRVLKASTSYSNL
jgi:hypothetical protein